MTKPPYIPDSVVGAPVEFSWKGTTAHVGPAPPSGPVLDLVGDKTTCGTITLLAGVLEWASWRFQGHTDTQQGRELSEAAFAYQIDWRYVDLGQRIDIPEEPASLSAFLKIWSFMRRALNPKRYWDHYYQPIDETFHASYILRHTLPKADQKTFSSWLKSAAARLDTIAPKPDEPRRKKSEFDSPEQYTEWVATHRGVALPSEVLDPGFDYMQEMREDLVGTFLEELDPSANRYLRSPEAMLELGFEGIPYRLDQE